MVNRRKKTIKVIQKRRLEDWVMEERDRHEFRNANEYLIVKQESDFTGCCAEKMVAL
jgi:hypothetical protein